MIKKEQTPNPLTVWVWRFGHLPKLSDYVNWKCMGYILLCLLDIKKATLKIGRM